MKKNKKKPLNPDKLVDNVEMTQALNNDVNILKYRELSKFKTIKSAFQNKKYLVILYETTKNVGHWCCLLFQPKNKLEFFDSYGILPDEELKFPTLQFRRENNMIYPDLTYLLLKCPYNIDYNNFKFQSDGTATCGRWCIARCLLSHLTLKEFKKIFNVKNPDKKVCKMTNFI